MSTDLIPAELQEQFDDAVDDATHAVIVSFQAFGMPEGDQLSDLMVEINNAISKVMKDWI